MTQWCIYYESGNGYAGYTERDWYVLPSTGVQVVVIMKPPQAKRTYTKNGQTIIVEDRTLIEGVDEYDPFGWGVKYGSLLSDEEFNRIWVKACGG